MEQLIKFLRWSGSRMSAFRRLLLPLTMNLTEIDLILNPKGVLAGSRNRSNWKFKLIGIMSFCCNSKCWEVFSVGGGERCLGALYFCRIYIFRQNTSSVLVLSIYLCLSAYQSCEFNTDDSLLSSIYFKPYCLCYTTAITIIQLPWYLIQSLEEALCL